MAVFADKGTDAPVIGDFIAAAGVSRGTFYNYFLTTGELLDAVTAELSDQVLKKIDKEVRKLKRPLDRLTRGCLLYLHAGVEVPHLGAFLARTGSRSKAVGRLVDEYLPRDLEAGRRAGEISFPTVRAARDLVIAALNRGIDTVYSGQASPEHLRDVMELILRALGVPGEQARVLSRSELPVFDRTSLWNVAGSADTPRT